MEFPLASAAYDEIAKFASMVTSIGANPVLYCNQLFAIELARAVFPTYQFGTFEKIDGYCGKYSGIPIYITETFPLDKPYAVIVPQFKKEN